MRWCGSFVKLKLIHVGILGVNSGTYPSDLLPVIIHQDSSGLRYFPMGQFCVYLGWSLHASCDSDAASGRTRHLMYMSVCERTETSPPYVFEGLFNWFPLGTDWLALYLDYSCGYVWYVDAFPDLAHKFNVAAIWCLDITCSLSGAVVAWVSYKEAWPCAHSRIHMPAVSHRFMSLQIESPQPSALLWQLRIDLV